MYYALDTGLLVFGIDLFAFLTPWCSAATIACPRPGVLIPGLPQTLFGKALKSWNFLTLSRKFLVRGIYFKTRWGLVIISNHEEEWFEWTIINSQNTLLHTHSCRQRSQCGLITNSAKLKAFLKGVDHKSLNPDVVVQLHDLSNLRRLDLKLATKNKHRPLRHQSLTVRGTFKPDRSWIRKALNLKYVFLNGSKDSSYLLASCAMQFSMMGTPKAFASRSSFQMTQEMPG